MGNCALKPKVLSETGAPAPEELKDSLLEYHKIDAAKSLSNLFLQDKAEKKTKDCEKITFENVPVAEDLKTALAEEKSRKKETKSPATIETTSPVAETKYQVMEKEAVADEKKTPENIPVTEDLKTVLEEVAHPPETESKSTVIETNEEPALEEKVIDVVTVKETETETEAKAEEVGKEAAQ
ncbi:PREDICTED: enolase-phosphatase E1-like [Camelina sativa]|uniref:Enolase-phosphatase E1-like n=1 Tax=Camelina sativa TaxID=90675 RepID=A0ABM0UUA6_CAMSA|nr:PREDICTED: enolase-phosphatase E1-like [Camelina sativa]